MQRSPLFTVQQALGATFTEVAGWELPRHFGHPEAEYEAVRHSVGLCDLSQRGLVRITGTDRRRFLHAMVSNDTQSLQPGQGGYATFLTCEGKIVSYFVVYGDPDAYLLDLEPHAVRPCIAALEELVISEEVILADERAQWGFLSLQGPRAAELLALVL